MKYDIIIIGAGLGGLTAGAKLSREGKKVLVIEQHDRPGGYATTFDRGDFILEVGLHELYGPSPGDMKTKIFNDLDVFGSVEFLRLPEFYRFINDRVDVTIPHNPEVAAERLSNLFPGETDGIRAYFNQILKPKKKVFENEKQDQSLQEFLDSIINSEDLKLILLGNLGYFHDDPYSLSLAYYSISQGSYFTGGASFIKGGSQKLSDHLAGFIRNHDGGVLLNHLVTSIKTDNHKVTGVLYKRTNNPGTGHMEASADEIIANTAMPNVAELLPERYGSTLKNELQHQQTGASLLTLYLGFNKPVRELGFNNYSTFIYDSTVKSQKEIHKNNSDDFPLRSFTFVDYSQVDSGLAPEGQSVGTVCCIDYLKDWEGLDRKAYIAKKERVASAFIERLEKLIPGIGNSIEYYEVGTPSTLKRYTLNPGGAVYGFAQTPSRKVIDTSGLPDNLHFASAWGKTGGRFSGAIYGGYLCAMQIMRKRGLLFYILAFCLASMVLAQNPYLELPLDNIKPDGWLKEMLIRQKNGATGHLDELYPLVMGKRNGWLGGDGDQWERGPYWMDGLLPLAYILDDDELKAKVKPWVEWTLNSQRPDGYFGPSTDYPAEEGLQRNNCGDWWPKMVMLKVLKQYYSATGDPRVIAFLTRYFQYQLKELPGHPLDHWTFWARYRGGDNLQVVYWLYNITGDKFLLDLADLLHKQTYDYTHMFLHTDMISTQGDMHCVNLAQGLKEPLIYFQHHPEKQYPEAVKKGLADIRKFMGQPQGMFGGDENIRNSNPVNGSELCSAVELMFSLESILPVTGEVSYADHLEKIAFNALPTQITDDFTARQYFQQPNQVMITRQSRNFNVDHQGTDVCFGLLTGYPCCTSNMHQGWPKFTQNLWYATPDGGLAALIYAPNHVRAKVADGTDVTIEEKTSYPFGEKITFVVSLGEVPVNFPLHFRIPSWCRQAQVTVNGNEFSRCKGDTILVLRRDWKNGDIVEIELPMRIVLTNWYENSTAVERGPLIYALKIGEKWNRVVNDKDPVRFGTSYYEVWPTTPWNYGLPDFPEDKIPEMFTIVKKDSMINYPWSLENAPVELRIKAKRLINWKLYNETAGPQPYSIRYGEVTEPGMEEITLIPYGCSTLRISEFPRVR